MRGQFRTKRRHGSLAFADFPEQFTISLRPDPRVREVGGVDLEGVCFGAITFSRGAVAREACSLVELFSLSRRAFVRSDRVLLARSLSRSCPTTGTTILGGGF